MTVTTKPTPRNSTFPKVRNVRLPRPLNKQLLKLDPYNERVKLFGVTAEILADPEAQRAIEHRFDEDDRFSKLIVYARGDDEDAWQGLGYAREGRIVRFFKDGSDATLWTRYSDWARGLSDAAEEDDEKALKIALDKEPVDQPLIPGEFKVKRAKRKDAERISELLQQTFADYPVDTSPKSLSRLIFRNSSIYLLAELDGEIAAMACAELDHSYKNAEISDCVTRPAHRGRGLMVGLMDKLIQRVVSRYRITDFYSLAKSDEIGMNSALSRAGFTYDGRLVNNCRMSGGWSNINVWWRTEAR
jgi:putative beta-lysine N-acetyltransferase